MMKFSKAQAQFMSLPLQLLLALGLRLRHCLLIHSLLVHRVCWNRSSKPSRGQLKTIHIVGKRLRLFTEQFLRILILATNDEVVSIGQRLFVMHIANYLRRHARFLDIVIKPRMSALSLAIKDAGKTSDESARQQHPHHGEYLGGSSTLRRFFSKTTRLLFKCCFARESCWLNCRLIAPGMRRPFCVFRALCVRNAYLSSVHVKDHFFVQHPRCTQHCVCVGTVILECVTPLVALGLSVEIRLGNPQSDYSPKDDFHFWKANKPQASAD
mmetsp:Transcript_118507/g.236034  ORF Transcript_118507/g.236034 Transcript_118507/m.236034 type:complete len:269 (-) Transcript_118507:967-1773(-)